MNSKLRKEFENPGNEYRGAPFWAWNGRLDPAELRRQIRILKEMGLGGFFMHSRVGMATEYLSGEFFEAVDACVSEAGKLGMKAWMYDEDRWPSGSGGGLVTKDPKNRMRRVFLKQLDSIKGFRWSGNVLAVFTAAVDGGAASNVVRCARGKTPRLKKGEKLLQFEVRVDEVSDWYNGGAYLDTMSRDAVRDFIRVTHEAYRRNCSDSFAGEIPGIFTDEPHFGEVACRSGDEVSYPWTGRLPSVFRSRYGYDIIGRLPEVFFDVAGTAGRQVRWHYMDCITWLFTDAFARQIGEWCEKNGIQHTGHVLEEETLTTQTRVVGSAMRFYEYMQAPGMDSLMQYKREYDTAKQVASVARQFGRKWRLTELYGCTGWDFPFEGHKAVGDWQAALGINIRCPHLSLYTMLGQAKRDYPASIFYQSPWWKSYRKVEDYFSRINAVMTRGAEVRDVLVIHPVESMWLLSRLDAHSNPEYEAVRDAFAISMVDVRDALLGANIDFDYGDEDIIKRHAVIRRGVLALGRAEYKAVVVPPMLTIRSSTLSLLKRFRAQGGTVVFAGDLPEMVDAMPSGSAGEFARQCVCVPGKGKRIPEAVNAVRRISIADERGREISAALYQLREDRDCAYLFVVNTGEDMRQYLPGTCGQRRVSERKKRFPCVRIKGFEGFAGRPVELDPEKGTVLQAKAEKSGSGWMISTSLPGLGSRLFAVPRRREIKASRPEPVIRTISRKAGSSRWDIRLSEDNCLVLDAPSYRIDGGRWNPAMEILKIDRQVRSRLGLRSRGGAMCQPWVRKADHSGKEAAVDLEYSFMAEVIPSGPVFLCMENPLIFEISVNGSRLSSELDSGWWVDPSLRRIPLDGALLRKGVNTVSLKCRYTPDYAGLEAVYILGDFGVRLDGQQGVLTSPPASLRFGDWGPQGLVFYSGNVSYCTSISVSVRKGDRVYVRLPGYRGTACRVLVDGKEAGIAAWDPNEVEITGMVGGGSRHELAVEVLGSRRNSHGPLHLAERAPHWTGPEQFVTDGSEWRDEFCLAPSGLMKQPELVIRRFA